MEVFSWDRSELSSNKVIFAQPKVISFGADMNFKMTSNEKEDYAQIRFQGEGFHLITKQWFHGGVINACCTWIFVVPK